MFGLLRKILHRRPWSEIDHWVLDLEATGLDPRRDEILSAGMVPIRRGVIHWGDRRYYRVLPEGDGASSAVTIHGLLPDETHDAIALSDLVTELENILTESLLVLHWRHLDLKLLRRAFRRHGVRWPKPRVVDTVRLLSRLDQRRSLIEPYPDATPTPLGEARQSLGLPGHREHHALYDALATAELYLALRARLG